jgi:hypothetical protein
MCTSLPETSSHSLVRCSLILLFAALLCGSWGCGKGNPEKGKAAGFLAPEEAAGPSGEDLKGAALPERQKNMKSAMGMMQQRMGAAPRGSMAKAGDGTISIYGGGLVHRPN